MRKFCLLALAMIAQPALAQDGEEAKLDGVRVELRGGYETPTVSDGAVYKLGNSATIGGEVGFDIRAGKVTIGPFVNYDYGNAETCDGAGNCLGSGGNFLAGARLGIDLGTKTQLYVKAGYDDFKLKAQIPGATGTEHLNGVGAAIGVAFNLSRNAYVGIEANYADLGEYAGINFQRRHVAATIGARF